jgi:hypothetical protein
MSQATLRRTDAHKLRRTISELLEQAYAVESSMEIFYRKGSEADLTRATERYDALLGEADRLGELLRAARDREQVSRILPGADSLVRLADAAR